MDVFRPPEAIYQFVDTNGNLTAVPNPITTNTPAEVTNIIRAAIQPSTLARVEALKPSDLFAVDVNIGPNAYVLRSTTISNLIATVNPTVINVRMFGAVGDGKADDSAAIRAAWNAWTNLPCGGVLYFPSGVYKDANPGYTLSYLQGGSGSLVPKRWIRGDGSGSTRWQSSGSGLDFLQFASEPIGVQGISFENTSSKTERRGLIAVHDTGSQYAEDVTLAGWDIGWDGAGGAGGKMLGLQAYKCGTGLRVSGYCDGWQVNMNARLCYRTGLEIGGTNQFPGVIRAAGGQFHVFGIGNRYGIVVGRSHNATVYGYLEGSTNGVLSVGHPPEFGAASDDDGIHGLKTTLAGVQAAGMPGIVIYARASAFEVDRFAVSLAGDQFAVKSMTATADQTPIEFEHCSLRMLKSTGEIVCVNARTFRYNWPEFSVGNALGPFSALWSDNATSNSAKGCYIGQFPWNMDVYRPQSLIHGRINSASSASLNIGGGTSAGKPYSEHKFWIGDPSQAGTGSNVFAILPTGLYGNAQGLTNMPGVLKTNAANIACLSVLPGLQYAERSDATTIGGFQGKWAGFGNKGTLIIKNTSGTDMPVRWPAGTRIQNLRDGSRDCIITNGGIGQFDILYYPEVTTNVLFSNPY